MKVHELWKLSGVAYKEVSFQSIFSLRAGSSLPRDRRKDVKQLVTSARVNALISKLVTTIFVAIFAVFVFLPIVLDQPGGALSKETAISGGVTAYLTVILFLIVFMGLQVSTSFVSSRIVDLLSTFPISKQNVSKIVFLCFLRIFDIPLVAAAAIFMIIYFLVGGSALGGLILLSGVVVTEIFAVALTTASSRFFYSKVARAGGKSKWQTLVRLMFMLVWLLPTFGAYFVINFADEIVQAFAFLTQASFSLSQVIVALYPFSFGFLVSYATFGHSVEIATLLLSAAACAIYVLLGYHALRWTMRTLRQIGFGTVTKTTTAAVTDTAIALKTPWLAIIRKDLRVASRSPSYASLFFLPAIQTLVLGLTFSSASEFGLTASLGILTGISMLTLLLPPTLLAIEGMASNYMRHIPLTKRTLIVAKTFLSTVTYVISILILSSIAFYIGRNLSILFFGLSHVMSVAAATMLELIILLRKFQKEGFAVGNIYSRISTYILIIIPGYLMASLPLVGAIVMLIVSPALTLPLFLTVAAIEFAIMAVVTTTRR